MAETGSVLVVGAGIIGAVTAWRLAERGMQVTMLTGSWLSVAASHVSGGMLAPISELTYTDTTLLPLNLASLRRWPEFVVQLAEASGEDPGYREHPTLVVGASPDDAARLRDFQAFLAEQDLAAEMLTSRALKEREPLLSPTVRSGLLVPGDHSADNRMLWNALMAACRNAGVTMVPGEATQLLLEGGAVKGAALKSGQELRAEVVVLATGAYAGQFELPVEIPVRPVKGQIIRLHAAELPQLAHTVRGFSNGFEVYLVPRTHGELVVGATVEEQGFDPYPTGDGAYTLLRDARRIVPLTAEYEFCEIGVGWRPGTPDNCPILGDSGVAGLVLAAGHYRNGVLLTPITGDVIASVVCDGALPEYAEPFTLARFRKEQ